MFNHACSVVTHGHPTDIVLNVYSNRIFLVVTQFKKFGSLVTVNHESSLNHFNSNIYSTKVLFGKDDEDITVASRYIAEQIQIDRPLLLSICLKQYDADTLKSIVKAINKIKSW